MARPRKSPRGVSTPHEATMPAADAASAEELEEKRSAFTNFCRNPFCGAGLANRVTKYCEDKPNCQRYRAVMLHCAFRRVLARAGAPLAADESTRSSMQSDGNGDATFSIPRRKRKKPAGDDSDSGQQDSGVNGLDAADKRKKKKKKQQQQHAVEGVPLAAAGSLTPASSRSPSPSVNQDALPTEMRMRQRHIQRHVEAMAPTDGQQVEVELTTGTVGDTSRPAGGRAATAAQAVKQMDIELVPLGATNQAVNLAGGGRYVQSGNRTAGPTLPPPPPVPARPPPPSTFWPPLPPKPPSNSAGAAASVPVAGQTGSGSRVVPLQSFTAVPQVSRPSGTITLSGALGTRSASSGTQTSTLPSSTAASNHVADNGSSRPGTMRISASDYLSARKVQEAAAASRASTGASSAPLASSAQADPSATEQRKPSRDNHRLDSQDFSFSDWDQSTGLESVPPATHLSSTAARADYRRESQERPPLSRSLSHSDDRNRLPPSPSNRPDYRRSHSDTAAQSSSSHRDDRYVQSSAGDAYHEFRNYPEDRHRESSSYRSVDERARVEEYSRTSRDVGRRSPRRDRYEDGFQRDRSLPRESSGGLRTLVDAFGREIRREERDRSTDRPAARSSTASPSSSDARGRDSASLSNGHGAGSSVSASVKSSPYDIEPPQFSYHDKFVSDLLSVFIRDIPHAIGAVKNETKKPRKMKWYLDYVDRVVKLFGPDVSIEIKENKAVMLVKQREWLVMEDSSTVTLYTRVLHRLLGEALMWRHMREEAEKRAKESKITFGRDANMGITFILMWNELKTHTSREYIPLEKQVRYFCGARKHHWSFSVGNVEIGSGSHEDKRTAFNFATAASMDFLLQLRKPQPERRPWDNSRSRAQDQTSTERDDRNDRGRRREDRSEAADHRRSETLADRTSNRGSGAVGTTSAADPTSTVTPMVPSAVSPTEENASSVADDAQDTGGVSDERAAAEAPSQLQSTDGNDVDAAAVRAADTADVPGRLVDPRLRRPLTDPRLRHPSPTDPRANGPASNPRTQGPTTDPRAGAASNPKTQGPTTDPRTRAAPSDPRRSPVTIAVAAVSNGVNGGASSAAGTSARTADLSEDEMSISEESDLGMCLAAVPPHVVLLHRAHAHPRWWSFTTLV